MGTAREWNRMEVEVSGAMQLPEAEVFMAQCLGKLSSIFLLSSTLPAHLTRLFRSDICIQMCNYYIKQMFRIVS